VLQAQYSTENMVLREKQAGVELTVEDAMRQIVHIMLVYGKVVDEKKIKLDPSSPDLADIIYSQIIQRLEPEFKIRQLLLSSQQEPRMLTSDKDAQGIDPRLKGKYNDGIHECMRNGGETLQEAQEYVTTLPSHNARGKVLLKNTFLKHLFGTNRKQMRTI
jgi:hypothetical protein